MKALFSLFLLASFNFIDNAPFVIEADKAVSIGEKLELSGHVVIQSGKLFAESKEASCSHNKKGAVSLKKDVLLTIEDHGQIACDAAFLDPGSHVAKFSGEGHPVIYKDQKNELSFASESMAVIFSDDGKKIASVEAYKDVKSSWKERLYCESVRAHFIPENNQVVFESAHLTVKNQANLDSELASFDIIQKIVSLECVQGTFSFQREQLLHVKADQLAYIEPKEEIHLLGHVDLKTFLNRGPAHLSGINSCIIDHKNQKVTIYPSANGRLLLTTPYGNLKAGSVHLFYEKEEMEYKLTSLVLEDNVEIANTYSFKDPDMAVNRFALADRVELDCYERVMTLKADKNRHVLFWDDEKKVQVSADAIAVCYKDGQEEISGKGAVRMLFNESELFRLTEHFRA